MEDPEGKSILNGNQNYPLTPWGPPWSHKTPPVIDSKTMMNLTFTAHLHLPTHLSPTLSLHKAGSIFSTWETVFETLVLCLFHCHSSLCRWILSAVSDRIWSVWDPPPPPLEPGALAPLYPGHNPTNYMDTSTCREGRTLSSSSSWTLARCHLSEIRILLLRM